MSTYVLTHLAGPTQLTAVAATVYTSTGKTQVKSILVANTGAATTFTISRGTDASGTRLFPAVAIAANQTVIIEPNLLLENTDFLQAFAGVAARVNIDLSGVIVS